MADSTTLHYGLVKPDNSASTDTWGVKGNANLDSIDNLIYNLRTDLSALQTQVGTNSTAITVNKAAYDTYVAAHTFPSGAISIWKGAANAIPDGWVLCDGNNGSPDLRDKFVVGAGNTYAPSATGGSISQTPTITVANTTLTLAQIPSHNHGYSDPGHAHGYSDPGHVHGYVHSNISNAGGFNAGSGGNQGGYSDNTSVAGIGIAIAAAGINITIAANGGGQPHNHTASSTPIDIRPPYMALCYIMKV